MISARIETGVVALVLFLLAISLAGIARGERFKFESKNLSKAYTKYKSAVTRANTAYKKKNYEIFCKKLKAMEDIQQTLYGKLELMRQQAKRDKDKSAIADVKKSMCDLLSLQKLDLGESNDEMVEKYNTELEQLDKKYKPMLDVQAGKRNIKIKSAHVQFLRVLDREISAAKKSKNSEQLKIMEACKAKVEARKNPLPTGFPHIKPHVRYTLQIKPEGSLGLNAPSDIFNDCDESTYEIWIRPADIKSGNFLWDGDDHSSNDRFLGLKNGKVVYYFDEDDNGKKQSLAVTSETELKRNKWYHIVCVAGSGKIKIYINGELDVQRAATVPDHSNTSKLFLGCGRFHNKFWMDPFSGKIADVRIWRRALDGFEAYQAYHGVNINKQSLIGEWDFSKGKPVSSVPKNIKATVCGNARLVKMRR